GGGGHRDGDATLPAVARRGHLAHGLADQRELVPAPQRPGHQSLARQWAHVRADAAPPARRVVRPGRPGALRRARWTWLRAGQGRADPVGPLRLAPVAAAAARSPLGVGAVTRRSTRGCPPPPGRPAGIPSPLGG